MRQREIEREEMVKITERINTEDEAKETKLMSE